ncbi:lipase [Aspergillus insuetus]
MAILRNAIIWSLVAFSEAVVGLRGRPPHIPSKPLPPSQDPWYKAPIGFESQPPGAILRIRQSPSNIVDITGNCSKVYNILYRTTDSRYRPAWAVTTLFVPEKPRLSNKALLSYQIPYNTVNVDASPSFSLQTEPSFDIVEALGRGWYVNTPDFEGPLAANVAGIQEGHATLDSLRAALAAGVGLQRDARVALWGYSGGSIASEWALEFQEQYAPELKIDGAALGGLVANNTHCIDMVQNGPLAYIAVGAMMGPLIQHPEAFQRLINQLKPSGPYNKTGFLAAFHLNGGEFEYYAGQNIYDYFVNGAAVLHDPLIRQTLLENQFMTYHGVPRSPIFIYKAIADEATAIEDSDYYVERNCMLGANILYERNTVGGHLDEYANGVPRARAWLESVLDGSYPDKYQTRGCIMKDVTIGEIGATDPSTGGRPGQK